jgi:hypothetical protein
MIDLQLPHNWQPRPYQVGLWNYLCQGGTRAVVCAHRRWGKDDVSLHHAACAMMERRGNYGHMLPEYAQGRKAIWDAVNPKTSKRRIDEAFPLEMRHPSSGTNNQEMKITSQPDGNGNVSTWQVLGSDNYNSLMGTSYAGIVKSEEALSDPSAWAYLSPILRENNGWGVFISTPRGHNHFERILKTAQSTPGWYGEVSPVTKTTVFTPEELQMELQQLQDLHGASFGKSLWLQEYFCLSPVTRVLMADLTWKTMGEVREGDELIGVDEEADQTDRRKLRRSVVTKRWETVKKCRRLTFSDGTKIVSSDEHPWLCKRNPTHTKKRYHWMETKDLAVGMRVAHVGLKPWETDRSREGGYLAGLYDGEGCVSRRTVQVSQKPGAVLDCAKRLLAERALVPYETGSNGTKTLGLSLHDTLRFLGTIRPLRMMSKAHTVWEGVFPFLTAPALEIVAIEELGDEPVVGISTSTKTFIAEGLVTHNCSFEAAIPGSFWAESIDAMQLRGAICDFDHDRTKPVFTVGDLGRTDDTAIWFYQIHGEQLDVIDYWAGNNHEIYDPFQPERSLVHMLLQKHETLGYRYAQHWWPHDARPRRLGMGGKSILQQFVDAGKQEKALGTFHIVPHLDVQEGIQAGRATFRQVRRMHATRCSLGIEALRSYHRTWDPEKKMYLDHPEHDWSSHPADGWRYLSLSWKPAKIMHPEPGPQPISIQRPTWGQMVERHFERRKHQREWSGLRGGG